MKTFIGTCVTLVIVIVGFYLYFIAGNQLRAWRAEIKGTEFVSKLYADYTIAGQSCQGEDTNADSYVTCNFRLKSPTTAEDKVITLQCPTFIKSFMGTSCKEQGYVITQ